MRRPALALPAALLALVLGASPAAAVTPGSWTPVGPATPPIFPGAVSQVRGSVVGPDGRLYMYGDFDNVGGDPTADNLAVYDPVTNDWTGLGSFNDDGALNDRVNDIVFVGSSLWAVGMFTNAAGNANADYLAVWNGSSWTSRTGGGGALSAAPYSIEASNGRVYMTGQFQNAGGDPTADEIAVWDGTGWSGLASAGALNGDFATALIIWDLAVAPDGRVFVGGNFSNLGPGGRCDYTCWWDPASEGWQSFGNVDGQLTGVVYSVALWGSSVVIGGQFVDASGNEKADSVARWSGTAWTNLGSNAAGTGGAITEGFSVTSVVPWGYNLIVTGLFPDLAGIGAADCLAAFNGTKWLALSTVPPAGITQDATVSGRDLYVAGSFGVLTSTGELDDFVRLALPAAPSAPRSLTGVAGSRKVTLSWAAPSATNGGAVRDYVVQYRRRGTTTWKTFVDGVRTTRSATVTGLTRGVTYEFRVRAKNDWGTGSPSATIRKTAG